MFGDHCYLFLESPLGPFEFGLVHGLELFFMVFNCPRRITTVNHVSKAQAEVNRTGKDNTELILDFSR